MSLSTALQFLQPLLHFRARQAGGVQRRVALREQTLIEREAEFHDGVVVRLGVEHERGQ